MISGYPGYYPKIQAPGVPPELLEEIRRTLAEQTERSGLFPSGGTALSLPAFNSSRFTVSEPDLPTYTPPVSGYQMNRGPVSGVPTPWGAPYGYSSDSAPLPGFDVGNFNPDAATSGRERLVTGTPGEANPMTGYERSIAELRAAEDAPVKGSRGMSALYGATEAMHGAKGTDSLGYMLGAGLGGGLSGLINSHLYGNAKKKADIEEAKGKFGLEAALEKDKRDREEQAVQNDLRRAQAEKARRPAQPKYQKDARGRLWLPDPDDPTRVTPVTDENGKVLDAKFERPFTIPYLMPDGVSYGTAQYDRETDSYKPIEVGGQPVVGKQAQPVIAEGENKGRTPQQVAQDTQKEEDRKARERIAKWNIDSRDTNARLNRKVQQDRIKLSETQFKARYPGAGRTLTKDYIIQKYKQLSAADPAITIDHVMSSAIRQGFQIED